ncbi:MAG: glycosyltransferase family 2 protein [Anaerolineae bacterium]|nr:glycosyltransferase family 2 protein [Anaerolineae bacterium]
MPTITFIVPAYNEEEVIAAKLENLFTLDYPAELCQIIVISDGSTDRTPEIVADHFQMAPYTARSTSFRNRALSLFQPERRGKIAALNRAVPYAEGEILIFSDANAMMEPQSIGALVANFADPQVACVGGEKHIRVRPLAPGSASSTLEAGFDRATPNDAVQAEGESAYWRYEAFVKRADSLVSTAIGAVGEFFAIRRELYQPQSEDNIIEDFIISMRLVMDGWRVVYEPNAVTWEDASPDLSGEWTRRTRNATGGFQAIGRLRGLLSPRYGLVAVQYISHKVLRWLAAFFMILAFLTNVALLFIRGVSNIEIWYVILGCQIAFYVLALLGWILDVLGVRWKPARIVFYFCFTNATALGGFGKYITGSRSVLWKKVR